MERVRRHPAGLLRRTAVAPLLVAFAMVLAASIDAPAATSSSTIAVTVLSATSIDAAGCQGGVAGRTDFGTVLPGSNAVTTSDCYVIFGSTNDSAMLRLAQADGIGKAMVAPSYGNLDASFGASGKRTTSVGAGAASDDARGIAIQPDGKIVVAGRCNMGATGIDFCVERYGATGTLDASFGTGGIKTTAIAPGGGADNAFSVAVQADGKIVVAGYCAMGGASGTDICLARYSTAGALDASFGSGGVVTRAIAPGAGSDTAYHVVVQSDGRIVVVGSCAMGGATGSDVCIARFASNGSPDPWFGTSGATTTAVGPGANADTGFQVAIQSDGKLVVAGECDKGGATGVDFCVLRYTTSGALDTTYATSGVATTPIAPGTGTDSGYSLGLQADGKAVVGGSCAMGGATGTDLCLARYTTSGALDTTYGTSGKRTTSIGPGANADFGFILSIAPDDKAVLTGRCDMGATGQDACTARYTTTGSLDTTFDSDGIVTTAIAPGASNDSWLAVTNGPDGKVIIAGGCDMGASGSDVCLAQYAARGTLLDFAGGSADWTTAGTSMLGACLKSVSGGASTDGTTWSTTGNCGATNADPWRPIVATPATAGAKVAKSATTGTTSARVNLRFGMRASNAQMPGGYVARVTFDVAAPNV